MKLLPLSGRNKEHDGCKDLRVIIYCHGCKVAFGLWQVFFNETCVNNRAGCRTFDTCVALILLSIIKSFAIWYRISITKELFSSVWANKHPACLLCQEPLSRKGQRKIQNAVLHTWAQRDRRMTFASLQLIHNWLIDLLIHSTDLLVFAANFWELLRGYTIHHWFFFLNWPTGVNRDVATLSTQGIKI